MTQTARAGTAPPRWREVFTSARGRLTTGLLTLEALVAVEILIVAAILPAVQRDLQGLRLYGWNFAALTLASFGAVPIAGRLTDRLGPCSVLGAAIGIYGVGLVLAVRDRDHRRSAPRVRGPTALDARPVQSWWGRGVAVPVSVEDRKPERTA